MAQLMDGYVAYTTPEAVAEEAAFSESVDSDAARSLTVSVSATYSVSVTWTWPAV